MNPLNEISMDPLKNFHIVLLQLVHENFHGPFWKENVELVSLSYKVHGNFQ